MRVSVVRSRATGTRRSALAALIICVAVAGCTSSKASPKPTGSKKLTLETTTPTGTKDIAVTWNVNGEPPNLNPIASGDPNQYMPLANMCEPLVRARPDFQLEPALASSYTQPNPSTWLYTIRAGAKFWDGAPVTPEDVVFSLKRAIDPKASYYAIGPANAVEDISAVGSDQVKITFNHPSVAWNPLLALPGFDIVEKRFVEKAGPAFGTPQGGLMCTGPYKLDTWTAGQSLTLTKNASYWDTTLQPVATTVHIHFLSDPSTLTNALITGTVQGAHQVPYASLATLQGSKAGSVHYGPSLVVQALSPARPGGPGDDPKVRLALSLAIDREAIARTVYGGGAVPTGAVVTPSGWAAAAAGHPDEQAEVDSLYKAAYASLSPYRLDMARAKTLIADRQVKGPVVVAFIAGAEDEQVAQIIQQESRQIGLTMTLKPLPRAQFAEIANSPDVSTRAGIDFLLTPVMSGIADPAYNFFYFASKNLYNYNNYLSIIATMTQALSTEDPIDRAKLVIQAWQQFQSDTEVIGIAYLPQVLFMNKAVTGATPSFSYVLYPWLAKVGGP